jgi:hypothetical protein
MTVDQMQPMNNLIQELNQKETPKLNVQQELQKDVMEEASGVNQNSTQKQLLQMMATAQPLQQIQQTAQQQIERGELDIRV